MYDYEDDEPRGFDRHVGQPAMSPSALASGLVAAAVTVALLFVTWVAFFS